MEKMSGTSIEGPPPPKVSKIDPSEHDGGLNLATKCIAFSISVNFYSIIHVHNYSDPGLFGANITYGFVQ